MTKVTGGRVANARILTAGGSRIAAQSESESRTASQPDFRRPMCNRIEAGFLAAAHAELGLCHPA